MPAFTELTNTRLLTTTWKLVCVNFGNFLILSEPGRRDDLESLGYLFIYFITGNLPWAKKYARVKKQYRRSLYGKVKSEISLTDLTRDVPSAFNYFVRSHPVIGVFLEYFTYVMSLGFVDKPDYDYLRQLMQDALTAHKQKFDNVFDWTLEVFDAVLSCWTFSDAAYTNQL